MLTRSCIALLFVFLAGTAGAAPREWGTTETDAFFWQWFVQSQSALAKIRTGQEPVAASLGAQLRAIDHHLVFELGPPAPIREFVISADGVRETFPSVTRLVAAAPPLKGWKVIAFRQRKPGQSITKSGITLDPKTSRFSSRREGNKLAVEIYVKGMTMQNQRELREAGMLLLDATVGEFDVEHRLSGIAFRPLPEAPDPTLRPLSELPAEVDALKPPTP